MSFEKQLFDLLDGINTTEFISTENNQSGGNFSPWSRRPPGPPGPPMTRGPPPSGPPMTRGPPPSGPPMPRGQPRPASISKGQTKGPPGLSKKSGAPSMLVWIVISIFIFCCICCLISSSVGIALRDKISDIFDSNEGFNPNIKNNKKNNKKRMMNCRR